MHIFWHKISIFPVTIWPWIHIGLLGRHSTAPPQTLPLRRSGAAHFRASHGWGFRLFHLPVKCSPPSTDTYRRHSACCQFCLTSYFVSNGCILDSLFCHFLPLIKTGFGYGLSLEVVENNRVTFRANIYGSLDRAMAILQLCRWKFSHKKLCSRLYSIKVKVYF